MLSKDQLVDAIAVYDVYSTAQRKILSGLVRIADNTNCAVITLNSMGQKCGVTSASVYNAVKLFERDGMLHIVPYGNRKISKFILNESTLESILEYKSNLDKM